MLETVENFTPMQELILASSARQSDALIAQPLRRLADMGEALLDKTVRMYICPTPARSPAAWRLATATS
jgi:hypothetical protein